MANEPETIETVTNVFGSAIVQNVKNCPDCKGFGEVWVWNDAYQGHVPEYCKCGVQIGVVPEPPLEDEDDDDREQIQPGDYHYYNRA
jgi:hypothetical protein